MCALLQRLTMQHVCDVVQPSSCSTFPVTPYACTYLRRGSKVITGGKHKCGNTSSSFSLTSISQLISSSTPPCLAPSAKRPVSYANALSNAFPHFALPYAVSVTVATMSNCEVAARNNDSSFLVDIYSFRNFIHFTLDNKQSYKVIILLFCRQLFVSYSIVILF